MSMHYFIRIPKYFFDLHTPVGQYMFKVDNRNNRKRCEICSKLTTKTLERRYGRHSDVFIVGFEHILNLVLIFLLVTLSRQMPTGTHTNFKF